MVRKVDGQPALVPDHSVKRRRDHRLVADDLAGRVTEHLSRRVLPGIAAAFNYRVTRLEPFKVVCCESATGDYFRRHRDNVTPDARHRRFALSINLNDDYQGGSLVFPEFGPEGYSPPQGRRDRVLRRAVARGHGGDRRETSCAVELSLG